MQHQHIFEQPAAENLLATQLAAEMKIEQLEPQQLLAIQIQHGVFACTH
jgi:hypothetical protein